MAVDCDRTHLHFLMMLDDALTLRDRGERYISRRNPQYTITRVAQALDDVSPFSKGGASSLRGQISLRVARSSEDQRRPVSQPVAHRPPAVSSEPELRRPESSRRLR